MEEPGRDTRGGGALDALTVALVVFFVSLLLIVAGMLFLPGVM